MNVLVVYFSVTGNTKTIAENSGKNLAKNAGSGKWLEGKRFSANVSESELKEWVDDAELHSSDTEPKTRRIKQWQMY